MNQQQNSRSDNSSQKRRMEFTFPEEEVIPIYHMLMERGIVGAI